MKYGTSHFISIDAARRYYRAMHPDDDTVQRKIEEGDIHIGKPETKPGETVTINRAEGRYFIQEN